MGTVSALTMLNLSRLEEVPLQREPFEYLIVRDILHDDCKAAIAADFPCIDRHGSFPLSTLQPGPAFRQLVEELLSTEFQTAVGSKFGMDLSQFPTMVTARGTCSARDGKVHPDSKDKVITVLLYLNAAWGPSGGRLRLLRSRNLDDFVEEIPPTMGRLLIFRRCEHSWHGHLPCEGKRMSMQMNWVKSDHYERRERLRHQISSFMKRLSGRNML